MLALLGTAYQIPDEVVETITGSLRLTDPVALPSPDETT